MNNFFGNGWMEEGMMHSYGFIYPVIFLFVLIFLGSLFFKNISNQKKNMSPIDILNTRLAKGEISTEEYEKLKKTINNN